MGDAQVHTPVWLFERKRAFGYCKSIREALLPWDGHDAQPVLGVQGLLTGSCSGMETAMKLRKNAAIVGGAVAYVDFEAKLYRGVVAGTVP